MTYISLSRNKMVEFLKTCSFKTFKGKCDYICEKIKIAMNADNLSEETIAKVKNFVTHYQVRWDSSSRNYLGFSKKNRSWLDGTIQFSCGISKTATGRPVIDFSSSSERSKRRKTEEVRSQFSPQELTYAAQMQFRAEGEVDTATVIKDVAFTTPTRSKKYIKAYSDTQRNIISLTSDEALSIVVEGKLSKFQYNLIRSTAKEHNSNIYPNYEAVTSAKTRCYPENLIITESLAEAPLQSLLDHTVSRLLLIFEDVTNILKSEETNSLQLITKWGCDGSSGMSEYKQKFSAPYITDCNIFLTSLVPIQLILGAPNTKNHVLLWQNPRPSSPRYCRPMRVQFVHETTDTTVEEVKYIKNQISSLQPTSLTIKNCKVLVNHKLLFTMIDGKVCNAVSDNSSTQKCYLCGLSSKNFNNIELVKRTKVMDESHLQFGLSSLHAWIRFFECILHLSYKMAIGKWQARGNENKQKVAENKKKIQEAFRLEMGLLVDKPKPGYGSSNDGNTARRFFDDPETSSRITGVDKDIIWRFKVILATISCGHKIKVDVFKNYCLDTASRFVELYPWYNMPTTVHKILIHAPEIISYASLPIGQLGEEAQEARNKDIKRYREGFSRKFSRQKNMEDVFHHLLVSSDPFVTSMRKLNTKKLNKYPTEVINFLEEPDIIPGTEESSFTHSHNRSDSDSD